MMCHSLYGGQAEHATTLNVSVTKANMAFVQLQSSQDHREESMKIFESALLSQRMLLSDADETLLGTMDHLAVANLLCGYKEKALTLLWKMLHAQETAFGANDERCNTTRSKIRAIQAQKQELTSATDEASTKTQKGSSKRGGSKPKGVLNKLNPLRKKGHGRMEI